MTSLPVSSKKQAYQDPLLSASIAPSSSSDSRNPVSREADSAAASPTEQPFLHDFHTASPSSIFGTFKSALNTPFINKTFTDGFQYDAAVINGEAGTSESFMKDLQGGLDQITGSIAEEPLLIPHNDEQIRPLVDQRQSVTHPGLRAHTRSSSDLSWFLTEDIESSTISASSEIDEESVGHESITNWHSIAHGHAQESRPLINDDNDEGSAGQSSAFSEGMTTPTQSFMLRPDRDHSNKIPFEQAPSFDSRERADSANSIHGSTQDGFDPLKNATIPTLYHRRQQMREGRTHSTHPADNRDESPRPLFPIPQSPTVYPVAAPTISSNVIPGPEVCLPPQSTRLSPSTECQLSYVNHANLVLLDRAIESASTDSGKDHYHRSTRVLNSLDDQQVQASASASRVSDSLASLHITTTRSTTQIDPIIPAASPVPRAICSIAHSTASDPLSPPAQSLSSSQVTVRPRSSGGASASSSRSTPTPSPCSSSFTVDYSPSSSMPTTSSTCNPDPSSLPPPLQTIEQVANTGRSTRDDEDLEESLDSVTTFAFSNYDYFIKSCASRPPLMRSVSEDATVIQGTRLPYRSSMASNLGRARTLSEKRLSIDYISEMPARSLNTLPAELKAYAASDAATRFDDHPPNLHGMGGGSSRSHQQAYRGSSSGHSCQPSGSSSRTAATSISSHCPSLEWESDTSWSSPPAPQLAQIPNTTGRSYRFGQATSAYKNEDFLTQLTRQPAATGMAGTTTRPSMLTRVKSSDSHHQSQSGSSADHSAPSSNYGSQELGLEAASSVLASFDPIVADAIRRAAATVRSNSGSVGGKASGQPLDTLLAAQSAQAGSTSSLMGSCGNGFFGNAIRCKVSDIFEKLVPTTRDSSRADVVHLVEYGCLNSQSATLMPEIAEHWSKIGYEGAPHVCMTYADGPGADFRPIMFQCEAMTHETSSPHFNSFVSKPFAAQIVPPKSIDVGYSLMDLHCRHTASAAGISAASAAHRELLEFLRTRAVEFRTGGLLVLAFIQRQEDSKTHQPNKLERSTGPKDTSSAPLAPLLPIDRSARTQQGIIVDGVVEPALPPDPFSARGMSSHTRAQSALSPIVARHWREETVRTRSDSTPYRSSTVPIGAKRGDVWSSIPALLAPCIQRLVSMGYIKSDAAHRLLSLPLHPRTPSQTQSVLQSVEKEWRVEWSCGLPDVGPQCLSPSTPTPTSTFQQLASSRSPEDPALHLSGQYPGNRPNARGFREEALSLSHPAYTAFQSTTLSGVQFAEHAVQFIRVLYEAHFRNVLRDYAKLSRSKIEDTLDALNEVLREKIEEPGRAAALALELEVCVLALRRL